jgi:hypothetical protein
VIQFTQPWEIVQVNLAGRIMGSGDDYRAKALEILLEAGLACDDATRNELLNIAASYVRLVAHAERAEKYLARVMPENRSTMH